MSISVHTLPLLARIETRPYADHFIARHLGLTASCTSSAKQSAEYIVEKLLKKFVHDGAFKNPVLLSLKAEAEGVFAAVLLALASGVGILFAAMTQNLTMGAISLALLLLAISAIRILYINQL